MKSLCVALLSMAVSPILAQTPTPSKLTIPVDPGNYTAVFSFGSNNNTASLQLSMQNDWTFVMGSDCMNCPKQIYNYQMSNTFKLGKNNKATVEIGQQRELLTLEGFSSLDDMCLGARQNVTNET
jgi:hypothetical protein